MNAKLIAVASGLVVLVLVVFLLQGSGTGDAREAALRAAFNTVGAFDSRPSDRAVQAEQGETPQTLQVLGLPEQAASDAPKLIRLYEAGDLPAGDGNVCIMHANGDISRVPLGVLHDLLNIQKEYLDASEMERETIYKAFLSKLRAP